MKNEENWGSGKWYTSKYRAHGELGNWGNPADGGEISGPDYRKRSIL